MAKVLSLDVGGTLLAADRPGFCGQLCRALQLNVDAVRPALEQCFLTKSTDMVSALAEFAKVTGQPQAVTFDAIYTRPHARLYPDVPGLLEAAHRRDIRVVTFSNCTAWEADGLAEFGIACGLEASFRSFELGHAKPSVEAFAQVERQLAVSGADIIHVGDAWGADIEGARAAGWRAVHLRRGAAELGPPSGETPIVTALGGLLDVLGQLGWL